MRTVRCKFAVETVTKTRWGAEIVKLEAVHGGSEENQSFAAATPNGKLEITVDNGDVHGFFQPGDEFYLDLTRVPGE